MSIVKTLSAAINLSVAEVSISEINPIIFKTKVIGNDLISNLTKDGDKFFMLDTTANTAVEVTSDLVSKAAIAGLKNSKPSRLEREAAVIAESFGMVKKVVFTGKPEDSTLSTTPVKSVCDALNLKVTAVTVATQNEIIFKTMVLKENRISGLTQDAGNYYALDTANNTATLVNPAGIAEQATKDFLAGKTTDYTKVAQAFGLITSMTLEAKGKDAVEA